MKFCVVEVDEEIANLNGDIVAYLQEEIKYALENLRKQPFSTTFIEEAPLWQVAN